MIRHGEHKKMSPKSNFIKTMFEAARYCSVVALGLQPDIVNLGKEVLDRAGESDRASAKRRAKTRADEIIQDILYLAATTCLPDRFCVDAEEASRMIPRDARDSTVEDCLILDPIDGTLLYIENRDHFSICVGKRHGDDLPAALVLFPAKDLAYLLDGGTSYLAEEFLSRGLRRCTKLAASKKPSKVIYVNQRVPGSLVQMLTNAGFTVISDESDDIGAPGAILKILSGEAMCYLSHTRQVRDVLLGAILGRADGGYAVDWAGEEIAWPRSARLPRAIFGRGQISQELIELTRQFISDF